MAYISSLRRCSPLGIDTAAAKQYSIAHCFLVVKLRTRILYLNPMTYCLAIQLNQGLVFASDTRTNAGADYISSYRKMHVFTPGDDRLFVILSAGNLATTQEVLDRVQRDITNHSNASLLTANHLFEAATYLGQVSVDVQRQHADALRQSGVSGDASMILGGQLRGESEGICLIYPQGNYIMASVETPYLQIGESKYGKPMLDRVIHSEMSLEDGARLALISLDATIRSNVTVGPPFDLAIYPANAFQLSRHERFEFDSPYYTDLRESWQQGLSDAFNKLPRFEWE